MHGSHALRAGTLSLLVAALCWSAPAGAESPPRAFVEASGAWGFQFGETEYLPDGSTTDFQHPLVSGYAIGGTAGLNLAEGIALIAGYDYTSASSRTGEVSMVLDEVEGSISYHSIVAGLRLSHEAGPGRLRCEFAVGVALPYETELELQYGAGLAALPEPITGTGLQTQEFAVAFGGHGAVGYELPIHGPLYAAAGIKLKAFQSNNDGEETRLENFVVDFEAEPPTAVTTAIPHGDGAAPPQTNSVQDVRAQLALGVTF